MLSTVTDFLKVFKVADGYYEDFAYGDEIDVELVECNSVNAVFTTYEELELPKVDDVIIREIALTNTDECATFEEVVSWLRDYFNDNCDTFNSEYVSAEVYSHANSESGYQCLLSHVDCEAADKLEDKSYDFGKDKTLAYGVAEAYNKRCEVGFTIIKPEGSYGKIHNWQLFVTSGYFVDACLADYNGNSYHFNTPEVVKILNKVNEIRRDYNDNED